MTGGAGIWPYRDDAGRWLWVVTEPFAWELGKPGSGFFLNVPEGAITDLVTIPAILKPLVDSNAPSTAEASIIHDELLRQGFEQRVAAAEFYRVLIARGYPGWRAKAYYFAVLLASDNWTDEGELSHG